jgi:hypothetical protein
MVLAVMVVAEVVLYSALSHLLVVVVDLGELLLLRAYREVRVVAVLKVAVLVVLAIPHLLLYRKVILAVPAVLMVRAVAVGIQLPEPMEAIQQQQEMAVMELLQV